MTLRGLRLQAILGLTTLTAAFLLGVGSASADSYEDRRTRTGARLFRALLAADQGITEKTSRGDELLVLFYFEGDRQDAVEIAEVAFGASGSDSPVKIRDLPIRVEFTNDPTLAGYQGEILAGLFLVHSPSDEDFQKINRFAIDNSVVVFSPHEGDVEKGTLGGLVIEAQVRPYINLNTARESRIEIKEFFLKVAKVME